MGPAAGGGVQFSDFHHLASNDQIVSFAASAVTAGERCTAIVIRAHPAAASWLSVPFAESRGDVYEYAGAEESSRLRALRAKWLIQVAIRMDPYCFLSRQGALPAASKRLTGGRLYGGRSARRRWFGPEPTCHHHLRRDCSTLHGSRRYLEKEGFVEIVELRTLVPAGRSDHSESVRKTSKVIVLARGHSDGSDLKERSRRRITEWARISDGP